MSSIPKPSFIHLYIHRSKDGLCQQIIIVWRINWKTLDFLQRNQRNHRYDDASHGILCIFFKRFVVVRIANCTRHCNGEVASTVGMSAFKLWTTFMNARECPWANINAVGKYAQCYIGCREINNKSLQLSLSSKSSVFFPCELEPVKKLNRKWKRFSFVEIKEVFSFEIFSKWKFVSIAD